MINNSIEDIQNRVIQALMWLGFEDVEFEKRFSTNKFEKGEQGEFVYETNIAYSSKDDFLPDKIANNLISVLEKVVDHHSMAVKMADKKEKLEEQFQKE